MSKIHNTVPDATIRLDANRSVHLHEGDLNEAVVPAAGCPAGDGCRGICEYCIGLPATRVHEQHDLSEAGVRIMKILPIILGIFLLVGTASAVTWTDAGGCWTATDGSDILVMFNSTGTKYFTIPSGVTSIKYLVVAGAGGGGGSPDWGAKSGGGGAGGFLNNTTGYPVDDNSIYTIIVGAGGAMKTGSTGAVGNSGTNSTLKNASVTIADARGGGGGAGYGQSQVGQPGGSGGGGAYQGNSAGAGTSGQGNNGGAATGIHDEGGGGGAGSVGTTGGTGQGGTGFVSSITGESAVYAVGGNGGQNTTTNSQNGTPANSGNGGHGTNGTMMRGGAGADGIVILRYAGAGSPLPVPSFTSDVTSGISPLAVQFTDTSVTTPTAWNWSYQGIAGGNTTQTWWSQIQNATGVFTTGNYTIHLNVTNASGYNVSTSNYWINVTAASASPPVVADFTSDVTSGDIPLDVAFTDNSTNTPNGWAWWFGDEDWTEDVWGEVNSSGGWTARTNPAIAILPDGSIVLAGGAVGASRLNDVWISSDSGTSWALQNSSAGWSVRTGHTMVALSNGDLVLFGGSTTGGTFVNDTWKSTDQGATWTQVNASSGWDERWGHASAVLSDDTILIIGGEDTTEPTDYTNDTWQSTDEGATWTQVTAGAEWTSRYFHKVVALPNDNLILTGGYDYYEDGELADTWRSTDGGATWSEMNASSGWAPREEHALVAMPDGSAVLLGGYLYLYNSYQDVWRTTDEGATWSNIGNGSWEARSDLAAVPLPNGSIAVLGGMSGSFGSYVYYNDTWLLPTASSHSQNSSHEYTVAGTYNVTLQSRNADSYDPVTKQITATETDVIVANFTSNVTSGSAPLPVQFTDTSTGSPDEWAWYFGDETYGSGWVQQNTSAFPVRDSAAMATAANGALILVGGYTPSYTYLNDTWRSTNNGTTWQQMNASSGWSQRKAMEIQSFSDGSITMMGGYNSPSYLNDTWHSTDSGATWQSYGNANWAARDYFGSAVTPNDTLVIAGGGGAGASKYNDVWTSSDKGDTWTQRTGSASWTARTDLELVAINDTYLLVIGGYNAGAISEVWASPDLGSTWVEVNSTLPTPWAGGAAVLPNEDVIIFGGSNASVQTNATYKSSDGGYTWVQLSNANFDVRDYFAHSVMWDGSIVIAGGRNEAYDKVADVWRLETAGSYLQNPVHTYATAGIYSVALKASNKTKNEHGSKGKKLAKGHIESSDPSNPIASFDVNATTGVSPADIQFTDTSVTDILTWDWMARNTTPGNDTVFSFASTQNPVHTFTTGNWLISLNVTNASGYDTAINHKWINITSESSSPPVSNFDVNATDGVAPLPIQFTDQSTNVTSWIWAYKNATSGWIQFSTDQNPVYSFVAGLYDINLTAINAYGSDDEIRTGLILATEEPANAPVASFNLATPEGGVEPFEEMFVDTSTNDPSAWNWSYTNVTGNNIETWFSTAHVPIITFPRGNYTIRLNASNSAGYNISTQVTWMNVSANSSLPYPPVSGGTANVTSGKTPLAVGFTDTSFYTPTSWNWTRANVTGDNIEQSFSTTQNPATTFGVGNWSIRLNATNAYGTSGLTFITFINVSALAPPVASFTPSVTSGAAPLSVTFTDTSTNFPTSWNYTYRNVTGNNTQIGFATTQNPAYSFGIGNWSIALTASNADGYGDSAQTTFINVSLYAPGGSPPVNVTIGANKTYGATPMTIKFWGAADNATNMSSWSWSYTNNTGGGSAVFSTSKDPTYTFSADANYSVQLTATNAYGTNTSAVKYIQTGAVCSPELAGYIGNDKIEIFNTSIGSCVWTAPANVSSVWYLVVGGGGGGGRSQADHNHAGGGGGGGVLNGTVNVTPGTSYNVMVGDGGAGGKNVTKGYPNCVGGGQVVFPIDGATMYENDPCGPGQGENGGNSYFDDRIAYGGGGGGGGYAGDPWVRVGRNGGSGGGGAWNSMYGGTGVAGQGNDGSLNHGGGAGSNGTLGGNGIEINITGTPIYFGGGGDTAQGTGGLGGGGDGSTEGFAFWAWWEDAPFYTIHYYPCGVEGNGYYCVYQQNGLPPEAGVDYLGGGGGAGSGGGFDWNMINYDGADGGSGVVVLRYDENISAPEPTTYNLNNNPYPHEVQITLVDKTGKYLPGVAVSLTMISTTFEGTNWLFTLFGIPSDATPLNTTVLSGFTDSEGAVVFPLLASARYTITFTDVAHGISDTKEIHPMQTAYIYVLATTATAPIANMADTVNSSLSTYPPASTNPATVYLVANYTDAGNATTSITFFVNHAANQTSVYSNTAAAATLNAQYAVTNTAGNAYVWGTYAAHPTFGNISKAMGITLPGTGTSGLANNLLTPGCTNWECN